MAAIVDGKAATIGPADTILNWYPRVPAAVTRFVHDLVDARSALQPESQAVCAWDGTLTYRELSDLSSRLADILVAEGVGPEVVVPLFFEKSLWSVVGILAVMKAGGAFLALDISQPVGRIKAIVEQVGARFALTSRKGLDVCEGLVQRHLVVNARVFNAVPQLGSGGNSGPALALHNAAYYIFTSGSTGIPKGVVIEHSQLATTCVYTGEQMGCDGNRRALQFASFAFDAYITDIFPTLIYGGTACILSDWERDNDLVGAACRMGVNSIKITPSLANILDLERVLTLKTLILGGESVPSSLIAKWASKVNLILVYGPTECCVICFTTDCSSHPVLPGEIGRPVGCRGWIVSQDDHQRLAGIGEIGELVIEGPVVGRGYLGDAEKTARQFIERPQWLMECDKLHSHDRLYRTGDLARYLEDGTVCYAGRIDNQVKIRGQRLELEEVERKLSASLSMMDGVAVNHVIVEATGLANLTSKQLVAFLSLQVKDVKSLGYLDWEKRQVPMLATSDAARTSFSTMVEVLESNLKQILPSYAVPSVWIPMSSFPYTVSRKIDRKKLRQLVATVSLTELSNFRSLSNPKPSTNGTIEAHNTKYDATLGDIVAEVFNMDPSYVNLEDGFYQLGGDSLLAMRMVSVARERGLSLTVAGITGAHSMRQLASTAIEATTAVSVAPFTLVPEPDVSSLRREAVLQCHVADGDIEDVYPCSAMQIHYVTGYPEYGRNIKGPWHWQSQQVYKVPASVDLERFRAAWNAAIRRHQSLRTRLILSDTKVLQVVIRADAHPPTWVEARDLEDYLEGDKSRIMGFGDALVRLAIVKTPGNEDRFFVMTMQHIIYDAFSLSILFEELEHDYSRKGALIQAQQPTMSSFIKYTIEADKAAAIHFWENHLAGAATKPLLTFPSGAKLFDLHIKEISVVTKMPERRATEATIPTIMEAAAGLAIAGRLECADVVLYSDRSGRNLPVEGIQDLVGASCLA
jgi:amino acid adenylation domain-containing protein